MHKWLSRTGLPEDDRWCHPKPTKKMKNKPFYMDAHPVNLSMVTVALHEF